MNLVVLEMVQRRANTIFPGDLTHLNGHAMNMQCIASYTLISVFWYTPI